jgi:hypothetical protein
MKDGASTKERASSGGVAARRLEIILVMTPPVLIMLLRRLLVAWLLRLSRTWAYQFTDLSYKQLHDRAVALNNSGSSVVLSGNEKFGVPHSSGHDKNCSPDIIRIGDKTVGRPQILISGAIHGDERVGPQASLVTAELLVASVNCAVYNMTTICTSLVDNFDVTYDDIEWMAMLATSRDIFIVPAANCLGYATNRRDDMGIDPNRDFPYVRKDNRCLRSHTAQLIYNLIDSEQIQIVLTFHGGMEAIGYEWGSQNHNKPHDRSPDHNAHRDIASYLSSCAGPSGYSPKYRGKVTIYWLLRKLC